MYRMPNRFCFVSGHRTTCLLYITGTELSTECRTARPLCVGCQASSDSYRGPNHDHLYRNAEQRVNFISGVEPHPVCVGELNHASAFYRGSESVPACIGCRTGSAFYRRCRTTPALVLMRRTARALFIGVMNRVFFVMGRRTSHPRCLRVPTPVRFISECRAASALCRNAEQRARVVSVCQTAMTLYRVPKHVRFTCARDPPPVAQCGCKVILVETLDTISIENPTRCRHSLSSVRPILCHIVQFSTRMF